MIPLKICNISCKAGDAYPTSAKTMPPVFIGIWVAHLLCYFVCTISVTLYSLSCMSVFHVLSLFLDYIRLISSRTVVPLITLYTYWLVQLFLNDEWPHGIFKFNLSFIPQKIQMYMHTHSCNSKKYNYINMWITDQSYIESQFEDSENGFPVDNMVPAVIVDFNSLYMYVI